MSVRHNLPVKEIVDLYINKRVSSTDIARKFGVTSKVIAKRLQENGFSLRSTSEANKVAHDAGKFKLMNNGHGPNWQGGRKTHQGYVRVFVCRRGNRSHYEAEHRIIMEKSLGRKLGEHEIVHHKNGIKDDNRIENLIVVLRKTHHGEVCCPRCQLTFSIK